MIVDSDADLDDAVPAIVRSAFVYAGQKCSAASRVLVHEAIADALLERLAGAVEVLRVGQADDFATDVPPVIEREAQERVERLRGARPPREGRVVARARAKCPPTAGSARPRWSRDLPPDSPVLARRDLRAAARGRARAEHVDAACDASSARRSRSPAGCSPATRTPSSEVARRSPVGNLYVNRHITGAMVGRQPFGGNRRSGIGAKAGGPDYLLQFVEPHVVTENTMRHGLVVE